MEVHNFAGGRLCRRTRTLWMSWIVPSAANFTSAARMASHPIRRGIGPERQFRFQRFRYGCRLRRPSPNSSRMLRSSWWAMSWAAISVISPSTSRVDADGELVAEIVNGDMMDREAGIAGNHHDAFADALVCPRATGIAVNVRSASSNAAGKRQACALLLDLPRRDRWGRCAAPARWRR